MIDYKEYVVGVIVGNNGAIGDAEVKVYDKDILVDDGLGTTRSDHSGWFRVGFHWSDYKDGPFEGRPDIYVVVTTPEGSELKSKVYEDVRGFLEEDDGEEIFDLGTVVVS
jgi:hypothetical protein